MPSFEAIHRRVSLLALVLCSSLSLSAGAVAQGNRGFEQVARSSASYNEVSRQRDLQVMELQIKPMRLIWVEYTNKKGEPVREQVWYTAWRAINRPLEVDVTDESDPVNEQDPLPGPPQFVPSLTLVTYDDPKTEIPVEIRPDEVLPHAMEQILKIERGDFKDGVSVVQDFPAPVAADAEDQPWIYGVATWRNVDPDTDFFKVIFRGFSNGYQRSADPAVGVTRKVVVQKYLRPGDRFDPNLKEFSFDGPATWTYQPDPLKFNGVIMTPTAPARAAPVRPAPAAPVPAPPAGL